MSEGTGLTVECDVCGTAFDPTAAGGWCTNPECGEWKYDGDAVPSPPDQAGEIEDPIVDDGRSETTSSGIVDPAAEYPDTPAESEPATDTPDDETAGDGVEEESEGVAEEADEAGDASETADEAAETVGGADDVAETVDGADEAVEKPDETDDTDEAVETPEPEDEDAGSDSDDGTADTEITCPGCAEQLDAATNFCPNCGEDVSGVEPGDSDEITACPACGDDVDADDSFCASCGENLDDHRSQTTLTECPDCGAAVDDDDSFCADCGENLDDHRDSVGDDSSTADEAEPDAESAEEAPESLLLTTRGREIAVTDGETVGRKLREILTETGGDENDAVRIHREHIRFVREDGQFYLVDLGENPTEVNSSSLAKGDRTQISPGDEITLSDVATLTVAHP